MGPTPGAATYVLEARPSMPARTTGARPPTSTARRAHEMATETAKLAATSAPSSGSRWAHDAAGAACRPTAALTAATPPGRSTRCWPPARLPDQLDNVTVRA